MENQYKLDEQFKAAAKNAESSGFARMEAVWERVEEKLDQKKQRRAAAWWKYTGMAAILALFITVGTFLYRNEATPAAPKETHENNITVIDTQKINEVLGPDKQNAIQSEAVVVNKAPRADVSTTTYDTLPNGRNFSREVPTPLALPTAFFPAQEKEAVTETYKRSSYSSASPASGTIDFSGTVVDDQGLPIPGATVADKNGNTAITDMDGKYSINIKEGEKLEASYIGMENKSILGFTANNNATLQMTNNMAALEDVEIQAYRNTTKPFNAAITALPSTTPAEGIENNSTPPVMVAEIDEGKVKKRVYEQRTDTGEFRVRGEVTAAKQTKSSENPVSSEAIESRANANVLQSLQGQVAGLAISTGAGQPGSRAKTEEVAKEKTAYETYMKENYWSLNGEGEEEASENDLDGISGFFDLTNISSDTTTIAIRGVAYTSRGPLYVINGVPTHINVLNVLENSDIKSLEILKEAAATSIYGNRASSGAIIIETNKLTRKQQKELEKLINAEAENIDKIKIDTEEYESFEENKFENPAITPLSTFSIDVDNASYTNIRRFLNNGQIVPKDAVRVEEMINFFKYEYPQPSGKEPFSINTEYSNAPWNPKHKLLKIGLQGKIIPDEILPASNFVFLIDVSGSMSDTNKLPLLKESMKLLVQQMRPQDRIAIVVYAGAAGLVLPSTSGAEKNIIIAALSNLEAGGSTAGGAGIELAYKTAQENFIKNGNNRVILATDGDFNVGASSNTDMQSLIEEKRKSDVFLTCLGYGMGNYKDSKLETLADKGNGNYAYIDNMQEADRFLQKEFKGSMFAIAKDVKIQIEFNPKHVQSYRLIGYENRKLRDEDFANDAIDAGELGSGHTVTALYEIIPVGVESDVYVPSTQLKYSQPVAVAGNYSDELATIKFRHKKPDEDKSTEMIKVIPNITSPLADASGDFKFAAAVAWFGLKLRDSKLIPNKASDDIKALARQGIFNDTDGYRAEFIRMVDRVE